MKILIIQVHSVYLFDLIYNAQSYLLLLIESKKVNKTRKKVTLNIQRTKNSHKACIICEKKSNYSFKSNKLRRINNEAITEVFALKNVKIPYDSRACPEHFTENNMLSDDAISEIVSFKNTSDYTETELEVLIESLRQYARKNSILSRFENIENISNNDCLKFTGFSRKDFLSLHDDLLSMRNSLQRTVSQALAVYLFWLKTGNDLRTVAAIFGLNDHFEVSRYLEQVRETLMKKFVCENIGANSLARNEWLKHNTQIAKGLFTDNEDQFVFVADGTYCYCQKSKNNQFQRVSYSAHKSRHLVKPFVMCSTDGRIIDIYGFYEATKSDAVIIEDVLEKDDDLKKLLLPNDVIILDRGFKKSIDYLLDQHSLTPKMPSFIEGGCNQLKTSEANQSRLVTKCRWVVEVVNSHLKTSFKALAFVRNQSLPHIMQDFKISGALINKFFQRLISDKNDAALIISNIKKTLLEENEVEKIVKENNLIPLKSFVKLDADSILDFPQINLEDIKTNITLGSYQISQSIGYIAEHFKNGKYEIHVNKESKSFKDFKLLRTKIQSRHVKSCKYKVFVKYFPNKNCVEGIGGWYCTCKNGRRTVGCCSHVASIIYYLSHGKYGETLVTPAEFLISIFENQVRIPPIAKPSDETSDSIEYSDNNESDEDTQIKKSKANKILEHLDTSSESEKSQSFQKEIKTNKQLLPNCSLKHSASISFDNKEAKKTKSYSYERKESDSLKEFSDHAPNWGGEFILNGKLVNVINTCTIDYFLFFNMVCSRNLK